MKMRVGVAVLTIGLVTSSGTLAAQVPPPSTPQNPGAGSGPLGGFRGASNNPGAGMGDFAGPSASLSDRDPKGMPKGEYGLDLARRLTDAQKLVDAVGQGKALSDGDVRRIRNLMREDFIAWQKRYDLLPTAYRAERDRWLVDEKSMSPNDWAKQRLNWLQAQREWILARGG
jgi:hypothetical protein